jgi:hypothetical protein
MIGNILFYSLIAKLLNIIVIIGLLRNVPSLSNVCTVTKMIHKARHEQNDAQMPRTKDGEGTKKGGGVKDK